MRVMAIGAVMLLLAVSCSSNAGEVGGVGETEVAADSVAPTTSAAPTVPTPTSVASTSAPVETVVPATTTTSAPSTTTVQLSLCTRVTDFAEPGEQQSWRVTLDGVMGGLSSGEVAFGVSTMVFTGELVTTGGGFSLLRTPLDFDAFASGSFLVVRARTDGRRYEMVFKDSVDGRRSQLFHEAQVPFDESVSGDWQEVRVELSDLLASANGRPVAADPFDKDAATEMGIILKDGVDGPFQLELDWIDVCAE